MNCLILGKSINFPIGFLIFNIGVGDFPGSLVVKTLPSNAWSADSIPDQDTKVPDASGCGQKIFLIIIKFLKRSVAILSSVVFFDSFHQSIINIQ